MTSGVRATSLESLRLLMMFFFGTGTMAAIRQGGYVDCFREALKILVGTPVSWSAQALSTLLSTPSGPGALCGFTAFRTSLT